MKYSNLNFFTRVTFFIFDFARMLLVAGDSDSWKDSLGRTILTWLAHNRDGRLTQGIDACLGERDGKHYLLRHPLRTEKSSRDHWSYFIIYKKLSTGAEEFKKFIKDVPRMNGMTYWMKAIAGSKLHEWLYYTLYIPSARIGNCWNSCIRFIGRAKPERSLEWWCGARWVDENGWTMTNGHHLQLSLSKWQKFWLHGWHFKIGGKQKKLEILIPLYPIHNRGWQLYVMPESRRKEKLKRILSKRFGQHNLMLRLLYGLPVTKDEILNYFATTGYRPGINLDETCDRMVRRLTDPEAEYNAYEVVLLLMLFMQQQLKKYSNVH